MAVVAARGAAVSAALLERGVSAVGRMHRICAQVIVLLLVAPRPEKTEGARP